MKLKVSVSRPDQDCLSNMVVCSTGTLQGTVLAPFLFILYTADFPYNTTTCHLQKFSEGSAIISLGTNEDNKEYREEIQDFVDWCQRNRSRSPPGKIKKLVVEFCRRTLCLLTPVNREQGPPPVGDFSSIGELHQ